MKRWIRLAAVVALVSVVFGRPVQAQQVSGTLAGVVVDNQGQMIVGANVTLVNEGTNDARKSVTGATGAFTFPAVQPGAYTLRVERAGFQTYERKNTIVTANEYLALGEIRLTVGDISETVTITAAGAAVETGTAERSALISSKQLEMVAVRSRDIIAMLKVLPGVTSNPSSYTESETLGDRFGTRLPNVQGTRDQWTAVTVDGLAGNDMGSPEFFASTVNFDAIAEVKVQLNNYRAESGRNGGGVVSIVTKSGTKELRGSVYGYKRHESLNANDYFNNRNGIAKPKYRHTVAGLAVGGPVSIPHLFNEKKEKLFFFYSFENLDTQTPQPLRQVTVPTALERQGDFRQSFDLNNKLIAIKGFPDNVVPPGLINPNGQALLNRFPLPNATDRSITKGNYNYVFQESIKVDKRQQLLRLDFRPSEKDTFYLRGAHWRGDNQGYAVPAGSANWGFIPMHYIFSDDSLVAQHTHVFGPKVVNELMVGWGRSKEDGPPLTQEGIDSAKRATIGFTMGQLYPANNPLDIMPQASFGGVTNAAAFTYDGRFPITGKDTIFTVTDNATVLFGNHAVKAGIYFERARNVEGAQGTFAGNFSFSRDTNNPLDTNYAYSNALLGVFQQYTESDTRPMPNGLSSIVEGYLQDTWKLSRKLTLDYGLRLAWTSPWRQADGQAAAFALGRYDAAKAPLLFQPVKVGTQRLAQNPLTGEILPAVYIGGFVPGTGSVTNGMVQATDKTYPDGFRDQQSVQLEPRVGFSFDPKGDGKTAVRAGFGVFHNLRYPGDVTRTLAQQPPVQFTPRIYYGNMSTLLGSAGTFFPSNVAGWDRAAKTPTLYSFSVGVQRDIGFGTVVDLAYVGSRGRHLQQNRNINLVPPGSRFLAQNQDPSNPGKPLSDDFFRPYPGYGSITLQETTATSNYNSLQLSVNRRFTKGLQFGLAYTYSRAKGYGATDKSGVSTYRPREDDYVVQPFDQTHVLVFNYTWDVPKASKLWNNAVVRVLFDDWQLSGITTFASGVPLGFSFTTVDGADILGGGDGARVVLTGDPKLPAGERTFDRWFDTSVVTRPPQGDPGNAKGDAIRGPGINSWDMTVFKNFPIHGRRALQLRWEIYNVLNHTQWLGVSTAARFDAQGKQVNGQFGQITSTRTPRIMQGSVRFSF